MDRALQERIIGAIVLVVFAVLVVPVFLDGPATEGEIITESVTLPGQNEQERKQQTIVLERDRTQPVPLATQPEPAPQPVAKPAPKPAVQASQTAAEAPAEVKPQAATPKTSTAISTATSTPAAPATQVSATGMWAVQLGSFSNQANAERLAADLRKKGYAAFLSQLNSGADALHRVRVGPQKDRDSAEAVAAQLKASGHTGQVVPHP